MSYITYDICPVPKPRQTRSDKWNKRPAVMRYRAFADECRLKGVKIKEAGSHIIFVLPMPKSWTIIKKDKMRGTPHQQKPDTSNLIKALEDALYDDDAAIWDYRLTKVWGDVGEIQVGELTST